MCNEAGRADNDSVRAVRAPTLWGVPRGAERLRSPWRWKGRWVGRESSAGVGSVQRESPRRRWHLSGASGPPGLTWGLFPQLLSGLRRASAAAGRGRSELREQLGLRAPRAVEPATPVGLVRLRSPSPTLSPEPRPDSDARVCRLKRAAAGQHGNKPRHSLRGRQPRKLIASVRLRGFKTREPFQPAQRVSLRRL